MFEILIQALMLQEGINQILSPTVFCSREAQLRDQVMSRQIKNKAGES